ncbi:MAG: Integral membrane protein, partial [uncultured Rubrobacteraceae bacterium]
GRRHPILRRRRHPHHARLHHDARGLRGRWPRGGRRHHLRVPPCLRPEPPGV